MKTAVETGMYGRVRKSTLAMAVVTAMMMTSAETVARPTAPQARRRAAAAASSRGRRGRPRKFERPARAVTLTLPEDVITALEAIDSDLSRAVVRTVQQAVPAGSSSPAELARYEGNRAVILVPPSRALRQRTGVELVPLSDGRALLAFDDQLSISKFELRLRDSLADPALEDEDRTLFGALVEILTNARLEDGIELRHQNIVVLRATRAVTSRQSDADRSEEPPASVA